MDERARISALQRAHGTVPSSERVWHGGVDITHEPSSAWPWPYSIYIVGGRGERIREDYLRWHAEAVVE